MRNRAIPVFVLAIAAASKATLPAREPAKPGLVLVVGGVGGLENLTGGLQWAVKHAGIACEVRSFTWTHGKGQILKDLQDSRNHARKADELADVILEAKLSDPDRPIFVVARSGGAMLSLTAAGKLPAGSLERLVLLSPAVSPSYDLRPALRAVRQEIVSFYSDLDWFILGWGTKQFGTADRFYSASAGLTGFLLPESTDAETVELYRRLVQVRWNPAKILRGHAGGHVGTVVPTFLASDVAPWLKP